jgi:23S rRNA pseudouridine1911/1915/1917 synthase
MPAGATSDVQEILRRFKRQALHAEKLSFAHPGSGEPVSVQADPPPDFKDLLDVLKRAT